MTAHTSTTRKTVGKELEKFLRMRKADIKSMVSLFPEYYSVLLVGPPGVGKSEYCFKLAHYYLQKGHNIVYITTDCSIVEIKHRLAHLNVENEKIIFVDCYSANKKQVAAGKNFYVDSLANIENLSVQINSALKMVKLPAKIIFDSLSPLFLYSPLLTIEKFLHRLCSRIKTEYGFVIFTIHSTMHDEKLVTTLMSFVDGVIELKFDKNFERYARILYLKGLNITSNWSKIFF